MTIVVIGHGRSPEGKCWGSAIDKCKTVIRMWDNEWQDPRDYGQRYDYGLFVLTPKGLGVFSAHNKGTPVRGWLAYMGKPTSGRLPDRTLLVDPTPWCEEALAMGGVGLTGRLTLTRGAVAAAWAISVASCTEPVVLVGFDNVQAGLNKPIEESFNPKYWALYMSRFAPNVEKVYPIGGAKTATHDMSIEMPLLFKLAKDRNVDLWLAQDRW